MAPAAGEDFVAIAEVVKSVGLKGEVKLYPLLNWYLPLLDSSYLQWENGETVQIGRYRSSPKATIVTIVGCDDRRLADGLVGRCLGFRRACYLARDFPRPRAGLPFRYLDRQVRQANGQIVGMVEEVRRYGSQITLVVNHDGREVLVPAVEPILRGDAGLDGPLLVDLPEGLLDVSGD